MIDRKVIQISDLVKSVYPDLMIYFE